MYHRSASSPPILEQQQQEQPCYSSSLSSPGAGMASALIRRALSTGDLLEQEPVRRYTAAERRESIERYRSKRKSRNFQKKITYACRKTLAEGRRRIKGRFAHARDDGDQIEVTATGMAIRDGLKPLSHMILHTSIDQSTPSNAKDDVDVDGSNCSAVPEWWPAMEEALAREEEEDLHLFDGEMIASYLGVNFY